MSRGDLDIPWSKLEKSFGVNFPRYLDFFELMSEYPYPGDILNGSNDNTNGNDTIKFNLDWLYAFQGFLMGGVPNRLLFNKKLLIF